MDEITEITETVTRSLQSFHEGAEHARLDLVHDPEHALDRKVVLDTSGSVDAFDAGYAWQVEELVPWL